jgi:hypothetical protein
MSETGSVGLREIRADDAQRVGHFLHEHLNPRVSAQEWANAMIPPWQVDAPNHGFLLEDDGGIVGVYLAFYSDRWLDENLERFCNLAAWCVLDDYRGHSLRLVRALLAQKGFHFTDLSPSGNVVPLNERLRFARLDTATAVVPNLPFGSSGRGIRIVTDHRIIAQTLQGRDREIFNDHARAAAARHFLIVSDSGHCHVIVRKDRRKGFPLFASILHVSNPTVFQRSARTVFGHLLLRHGAVATLAEYRVVGFRPRLSLQLSKPRPKMYRSTRLGPEQIDYLYSELVCVGW